MTPTVGMGATLCINGDEYPCTITRVGPSGRRLWIRQDRIRGAGEFVEDPRAPELQYNLDEHGTWRRRGYYTLSLGERRSHWVREV